MNTIAGLVLMLLAIILANVYRHYGSYGVRSWLSAKVLNRPLDPPTKTRRRSGHPVATGGYTVGAGVGAVGTAVGGPR